MDSPYIFLYEDLISINHILHSWAKFIFLLFIIFLVLFYKRVVAKVQMPVAKLRGNCTPDAMRSKEGNDSLDTFIRQAIGKEPLLSFSRTGDSQVQLIQLLHALDQPGTILGFQWSKV